MDNNAHRWRRYLKQTQIQPNMQQNKKQWRGKLDNCWPWPEPRCDWEFEVSMQSHRGGKIHWKSTCLGSGAGILDYVWINPKAKSPHWETLIKLN